MREPEVLSLVGVRPDQAEGVFLNEQLVFHFSDSLDPASITAASVRILPAGGGPPARGDLAVAGRALVFTPEPVLAFDLADGGYLPGTTYTVELAGFPRPDGLRSKSGAPLKASAVFSFTTVDVGDPDAGEPPLGPVFEDPAPGRGLPVFLRTETVEPGQAIELEGHEPLDPSTLFAGDFVLRAGPRVRSQLGPPIPLRARLVDNRDRRSGEGATVVELLPMERLEIGQTYQLIVDERMLRLRDFGGHRVFVRNTSGRTKLELEVDPPQSGLAEAYLEYTETFIDDRMRSPEVVPGVDGTVRWTDTGRAVVRWPRSAGRGVDGALELGERHFADDVEATSIELGAGSACSLNAVPGLVVMRAQGRIELAGKLERRTGAGFTAADPLPFELELEERDDSARPTLPGAQAGQGLSDWLLAARAADANWTVLIAGGDLVLGGQLLCDGPVLLAAGGEIRVAAGARLVAPFVATVGHRSDTQVRYFVGQRPEDAWRADLALEAPDVNLLAVPLRYGIRSAPIPEVGGAARWHPGPRAGGHAGSGSWHLNYLGSPKSAPLRVPGGRLGAGGGNGGSSPGEHVADDPAMLEDSPTLRFELIFELEPGSDVSGARDPWDPPWVDSVQLRWDPQQPERALGGGGR